MPETVAVKFAHHTLLMEWFLMAISVSIAGLGIWFAYDFYLKHPQLHSKIAARWPRLHNLLVHKYYVDEMYDALFVNRVKDLSTAFGLFDAKVIDGLGVDGAGWLARMLSRISMWWDKWIVDGLVNLTGKFATFPELSGPHDSDWRIFQLCGVYPDRSGDFTGVLRPPHAGVDAQSALKGDSHAAFFSSSTQRDSVHAHAWRAGALY